MSGDGGGFGVESPAHKITNLRITINTSKQGDNDWDDDGDERDYERFFKRVRPPYALSQQAELTNGDLLSINHVSLILFLVYPYIYDIMYLIIKEL